MLSPHEHLEGTENLCEISKDPTRSCDALEGRPAAAAAAVKNQVAARVECHHDAKVLQRVASRADSLDPYLSRPTDKPEAPESQNRYPNA